MKDKERIYLLVGRSGSGKSSVADYMEDTYGWNVLQSYTTRPPRYKNERGHRFISLQEFNKLKNKCAYTFFAGYEYCATSDQVDKSDIYIIDPAGVEYFIKQYRGTKYPVCVVLNLSSEDAKKRLLRRKDVTGEDIEARLENDEKTFKNMLQVLGDLNIATVVIDSSTKTTQEIGDMIEVLDLVMRQKEEFL